MGHGRNAMIILFTMLILLVILVNGWTDAPNAIAGCVSTRAMSPSSALALAAAANFAGAILMAVFSPKVALTLYNIADFGNDTKGALLALCAGLFAVILWATVAWGFGLPTSESHALISGISGAALAKRRSFEALNSREWHLVIMGLVITTVLPFILGFLLNKTLTLILKGFPRRSVIRYFLRAERFGAASSALIHGAQDSQKFMGIYMLGITLYKGDGERIASIPLYVVLICASVMTLGTMLGGARIIKKIGCDMTELDAVGGSAADTASSAVLFICSLTGIPASTTHSKASAMIGTGICKRRGVDPRIVGQMFAAWGLTFPFCAALGYILSRLLSFCFQ